MKYLTLTLILFSSLLAEHINAAPRPTAPASSNAALVTASRTDSASCVASRW